MNFEIALIVERPFPNPNWFKLGILFFEIKLIIPLYIIFSKTLLNTGRN